MRFPITGAKLNAGQSSNTKSEAGWRRNIRLRDASFKR